MLTMKTEFSTFAVQTVLEENQRTAGNLVIEVNLRFTLVTNIQLKQWEPFLTRFTD